MTCNSSGAACSWHCMNTPMALLCNLIQQQNSFLLALQAHICKFPKDQIECMNEYVNLYSAQLEKTSRALAAK